MFLHVPYYSAFSQASQEPDGKMIDVPNAEALDVLLSIRGAYLREGLQDGWTGCSSLLDNALSPSNLVTSHPTSMTIG